VESAWDLFNDALRVIDGEQSWEDVRRKIIREQRVSAAAMVELAAAGAYLAATAETMTDRPAEELIELARRPIRLSRRVRRAAPRHARR
jgi:hypothetical protein